MNRPRNPGSGAVARSPVERTIKALFFDIDGVLTDGRVYIADDGREFKVYDTKDGYGIKIALAAGLKVAWISGRQSPASAQRARELGVRSCYQGVGDKLARYRALCRRWRLVAAQTAAIGDDEPDVPLLAAAGFSACPSDAAAPARKAAKIILKNAGGRGAVREFVERVLSYNQSLGKRFSTGGQPRVLSASRFRKSQATAMPRR